VQCSAVVRVCADRSRAHSHADKLVDGVALTTDDSHMWLIPFTLGNKHVLSVSLAAPVQIGALVLHNYNTSFEDSFRGVQVRYTNAVRLSDAMLFHAAGVAWRSADSLRAAFWSSVAAADAPVHR
jgi:hypothetical protein